MIEESDLQFEKHPKPKNSTDAGILINLSFVFLSAFASILSNFEAFSITID
jgi:hypothetical protein